MLLAAHKNSELQAAIAKANRVVVDGFGISLVSRLKFKKPPPRIPGVDLVKNCIEIANKNKQTVFLLGGEINEYQAMEEWTKQNFPHVAVHGRSDVVVQANGDSDHAHEVINEISTHTPRFIFVALGHGKQELWIAKNIHLLPENSIVIGVGGSFALLSGTIKRAPCFMRKIGLEWLWRLIKEPQRFPRIFRAVIVFPIKVLLK